MPNNPNTVDSVIATIGMDTRIKTQLKELLKRNLSDVDKAKSIKKISLYGPFLYTLLTQYADECVNSQKRGKPTSIFWHFYEHLGGNPQIFIDALSLEIMNEFENLGRRLSKLVASAPPAEIEIPLPTPSAPPAEIETPLPTPSAPPAEIETPLPTPSTPPAEIETPLPTPSAPPASPRPIVIATPRVRTAVPANATQETLPPYDIGPPPAYSPGEQPPAYIPPTLPRYDEVVPKTRTWREWLLGRRRVEPQNDAPDNTRNPRGNRTRNRR